MKIYYDRCSYTYSRHMTRRFLAGAQVALAFAVTLPTPGAAHAQLPVADSLALAASIGDWIQAPHQRRNEAFVVIYRPESPTLVTWARMVASVLVSIMHDQDGYPFLQTWRVRTAF
jgi:hypothetical protein